MKLRTALISMVMLALSSALSIAPRAAEGDPAAECGALGVMTFDPADLPEGVLPSDVRKCRDHPLGRNRHDKDASLAPLDAVRMDSSFYNGTDSDTDRGTSPVGGSSDLDLDTSDDKQACYYDAPYGCTRGNCWKACGDKGQWCWTATKLGMGSWDKCKTWKDCGTHTFSCSRGLGPSSGCGC
jgi:hypothetical protein